jgi:hypothetical protein
MSYLIVSWNSSGSGFTRQAFPPLKVLGFHWLLPERRPATPWAARSGRSGGSCQRSCYVCQFSVARNRCGIDAKHGDHFLQADSLPIACPDLDYFRFADNSVLFVGATNLIPPVSTSSLAAGRHNRKNQLDR